MITLISPKILIAFLEISARGGGARQLHIRAFHKELKVVLCGVTTVAFVSGFGAHLAFTG